MAGQMRHPQRGRGALHPGSWWPLGLPVVSGVALRALLLACAWGMEVERDERFYLDRAELLARTGVFESGWAPGFPYFLAASIRAFGAAAPDGAKLLQVALSAVIGGCVAWLALRLFDRRTAIVAGWLWAAYLPLAAFTHLLWPETLFTALLLPGLVALVAHLQEPDADGAPLRLAAAGLCIGAATLTKESGQGVALLCVLVLAWAHRGRGLRAGAAPAAAFALAAAVVVLPWTLRNWDVHQRFAPVGYTLGGNAVLGWNGYYQNHDYSKALLAAAYPRDHWVSRTFTKRRPDAWKKARGKNRIDASRAAAWQGLRYMAERPDHALRTRTKKLADFVNPMSFFVRHLHQGLYPAPLSGRTTRTALAALAMLASAAALALGLLGFVYAPCDAAPRRLLALLCATFAATALLVSMTRFRIPIMPIVLVFAAAALTHRDAIRSASRARHAAAGAALAVLAGLWSLNFAGVVTLLQQTWGTR